MVFVIFKRYIRLKYFDFVKSENKTPKSQSYFVNSFIIGILLHILYPNLLQTTLLTLNEKKTT